MLSSGVETADGGSTLLSVVKFVAASYQEILKISSACCLYIRNLWLWEVR